MCCGRSAVFEHLLKFGAQNWLTKPPIAKISLLKLIFIATSSNFLYLTSAQRYVHNTSLPPLTFIDDTLEIVLAISNELRTHAPPSDLDLSASAFASAVSTVS
jgi:hypothetical protein